MLRDRTLIPLSHQHQHGLALCVMTRRALAADSSAENIVGQARRVVDRFEIELVNHFEIEEEVLFPACGNQALVKELLAEHRTIEGLVAELRASPSADLLERFCALLTSHIRKEESELFEAAQRELPRETLDDLGGEIERRVIRVCL